MRLRLPTATTLVLLAASTAGHAAGAPDIRGIGLGMTSDQIVAQAQVPCRRNKAGNMSCVDPKDGSEFKVMLSGGKPPVAISIKHTFCSSAGDGMVLSDTLKRYRVTRTASRATPNGTTFDLSPTVMGVLNSASGEHCADGRKSYQFTLSDLSLLSLH